MAVTTITITYDRSDALCSGGAMTRLIAFSADERAGVELLGAMCGAPGAASE